MDVSYPRWIRYGLQLTVTLVVISLASTAVADEALIEISEGQLDLNEQGIQAVQDEDYERAIRLFEASLDLGELNITYVNLARVYQHAGDCQRAEELYEKAMDAPRVDQPAPDQIEAAVQMYRDEMADNCAGYLELTCNPENMALYIDGLGPLRCHSDGPRELRAGSYELRGEILDFQVDAVAEIIGMDHIAVELSLTEEELAQVEERKDELAEFEEDVDALRKFETDSVDLDEELAEVDAPPMPERSSTMGIVLLSSGVASLAGAVALDVVPDRASNGEFNTINFVAAGLYGSALGLGIMGIRSTW